MNHIKEYLSYYLQTLPNNWNKGVLYLEYSPVEDSTSISGDLFDFNDGFLEHWGEREIEDSWNAGKKIFAFFREQMKNSYKVNKSTITFSKDGKIEVESIWDEDFFRSTYGIASDDIKGLVELWIQTERLVALTGIPEDEARKLVSAKYGVEM